MEASLMKKILGGAVLVIVLAVGIFFRDDVSRMLSFDRDSGTEGEVIEGNVGDVDGRVSFEGTDVGGQVEDGDVSEEKNVEEIVLVPSQVFPLYEGRDPAQINPLPEDIKLFTEDQLAKIYSTIGTHAKAVEENPRFFNGWIQIGLLKKIIGDFEGARDAWEYAGVIEPLNSLSFANLGELYWRYLHEYEESEKNFRTSIKHQPKDPLTYISLADLYHYSYEEKKDQAIEVLLEGLVENPADENLMRHLAYIYELRGEYEDALSWWRQVAKKVPDDQSIADKIKELESRQ